MGIKDLNQLIKKFAPAAITEIDVSYLAGRKLAFDAYGLIHAYKVVEMNSNYFSKLYSLCNTLRNIETKPIFVFDSGKAMPEKHAARAVRNKRAEVATARLEERKKELDVAQIAHSKFMAQVDTSALQQLPPEQYSEMIKLATELNDKQDSVTSVEKQLIRIDQSDVQSCKELFLACGFQVGFAEHEGEAGCVKLVEQGIAELVISNDTDVLTFGDVKVVQNFIGKEQMRLVDAATVRREMGLSRKEFVDMCILCGCDFSAKLDGLASLGAYKLIQERRNIEAILANLPKRYSVPEQGWTYQEARHIFLEKPCAVELEQGEYSAEKLREFFNKREIPHSRFNFDAHIPKQTTILDYVVQRSQPATAIATSPVLENEQIISQ